MRRRDLLIGGGLAGASLLLSACGGKADRKASVLRASSTGKGEGDIGLMVRSAGLVPEGFTVDYLKFQSGHLVVEAMNSGALDYGSMSEIPPVFAAASTIQSFRQIAVWHGDVNNQVVLLPKGSKIAGLADLKGKHIGYVRATTTHYYLIQMLKSVGLGWGDITPVAMGVSDGAAAFSSGALDAWAIFGFPIQRAIATEGARVLTTARGFLSGNYLICAHVDALADPARSEIIGKYLRLVNRAAVWSTTHSDQWAEVVSKDIGVPLPYIKDQFAHRSDPFTVLPVNAAAIASQQQVADVFADQKLIPRRVDVTSLWDDRFNSIIEEKV